MNQPPPYQPPPWGQQGPPGWGPPGYGQPGPGYGHPGYPPAQPRKSRAGLIIALVLGALFLCGGVGYLAVRAQDLTEVLAADDGKSVIKIPWTWSRQTGLNSIAVLQAGNPSQEEYLIVISEPKDDYAATKLSTYAELCLENMKPELKNARISGPRSVKIGDRDALEYDVEGTVDSIKITYLATFVDGTRSFHQVMAWTLTSRFSSKKQKFTRVTATFRER